MKNFLFIMWMFFTLILTFSIIGMVLFIGETIHYSQGAPDRHKSTWMELGLKLLNNCLKQ